MPGSDQSATPNNPSATADVALPNSQPVVEIKAPAAPALNAAPRDVALQNPPPVDEIKTPAVPVLNTVTNFNECLNIMRKYIYPQVDSTIKDVLNDNLVACYDVNVLFANWLRRANLPAPPTGCLDQLKKLQAAEKELLQAKMRNNQQIDEVYIKQRQEDLLEEWTKKVGEIKWVEATQTACSKHQAYRDKLAHKHKSALNVLIAQDKWGIHWPLGPEVRRKLENAGFEFAPTILHRDRCECTTCRTEYWNYQEWHDLARFHLKSCPLLRGQPQQCIDRTYSQKTLFDRLFSFFSSSNPKPLPVSLGESVSQTPVDDDYVLLDSPLQESVELLSVNKPPQMRY